MGLNNSKKIPKDIEEYYNEALKIVKNNHLDIEIKKYKLNKLEKIFRKKSYGDTFYSVIYPKNLDLVVFSGIFGPYIQDLDNGEQIENYTNIKILYYLNSDGKLISENYFENFSGNDSNHDTVYDDSKYVEDIFDNILNILENKNHHYKVKKYLIQPHLEKINSLCCSNTFINISFPEDEQMFILSGIFGPFTCDTYTLCLNHYISMNIVYECHDNILYINDFYDLFSPKIIKHQGNKKTQKIKSEIDIKYDKNGIPIPPPPPPIYTFQIKYDKNGIPIPPPPPSYI